MKTVCYFSSLLTGLLLSGCGKDKAPAPVSVTFEVVDEAVYPSEEMDAGMGPQRYLTTRQVSSQLALVSSNHDTSPDRVQSATLSEVELQLTTRSNARNFDFLRSATIYLIGAQGARSVLAQTGTIPPGATRLLLTHSSPSMLNELKAGSYYVAPMMEIQPGIRVVADLQLHFRYQVQAHKR